MSDNKPIPDKETDQTMAELEKQLEKKQEATPAPTASKSKPTSSVEESVTKTSNSKPAAKTGLLWVVSLFNLLILVAIVAAGYWVWTNWNAQQIEQAARLEQQKLSQQAILTANTDLRDSLESDRSELQQSVQSLAEKLAQVDAQSSSNALNLADVSGRRPSDWLIAEADYLVRMAGRKIWLEKDLRTAILMLQSADSRLQDLADPSLLPIRQLIATDIQTLQQVNPVSLPSLALALSGMLPQVKNLPLALPEIPKIKKREDQTSESISDWQANLDKLWTFFKEELINYKPNAAAIRPLLSEQQQWLVREQLKLALLQAQSAVLQEQETLYQQSLQRALGLLIDHYDLTDVSVEQFVDGLRNLEKTDIGRELPDQIQSARPLQDLLKKRVDSVFNNRVSEL